VSWQVFKAPLPSSPTPFRGVPAFLKLRLGLFQTRHAGPSASSEGWNQAQAVGAASSPPWRLRCSARRSVASKYFWKVIGWFPAGMYLQVVSLAASSLDSILPVALAPCVLSRTAVRFLSFEEVRVKIEQSLRNPL
jgi:hypothetical protein